MDIDDTSTEIMSKTKSLAASKEVRLSEQTDRLLMESFDYRAILDSRLKELKASKPGFGLVRLCEKLDLHGSYVSAALKGQKSLSTDQLFVLAEAMGFHPETIDYLLLLLDFERTQNKKLQAKLLKKIESIQAKSKKSESQLKAKAHTSEDLVLARYYSNPIYKILHVFLGIEKYRIDRSRLGAALNLSLSDLDKRLVELEEMGVIKIAPHIQILKRNFHLPKDFFICQPHQFMMKQLSIQKQILLDDSKRESVCVTFSATQKDYQKIHQEFLLFLKKAEGIVKDSPAEDVFQMTYDLHHWA